MFLGGGYIATNIYNYILIFYRGIARRLWSSHIIQIKFHCVGVISIMCYCAKDSQHV